MSSEKSQEYSSVRVPRETYRMLQRLHHTLLTQGIRVMGADLAEPTVCPACGSAEIRLDKASVGQGRLECDCGYIRPAAAQLNHGHVLTRAIEALLIRVRENGG
jgi:hypothetical protein